MFSKILVPTDGTPLSDKAVFAAIEYAKENGSEIVALSVGHPYVHPNAMDDFMGTLAVPQGVDPTERDVAISNVEKVAALANAERVICHTATAFSFDPSVEIVKAVNRFGCDGVFMATHGRTGISKLIAGSETQSVLNETNVPVAVFR